MSNIAEKIKKIIVENLDVDAEKVIGSANFVDDLGADSLETVEIVMLIEEEFGVEILDEDAGKIQTVDDAINFVKNNAEK